MVFLEAHLLVALPLLVEAFHDESQKTLSNHRSTAKKKYKTAPPLSVEEQVRQAAASCLQFWQNQDHHNRDPLQPGVSSEVVPKEIHKDCLVTSLLGDDKSNIPGDAFCFPNSPHEKKDSSSLLGTKSLPGNKSTSYKFGDVKILPAGNVATIQVTIIPRIAEGFLSLLKSPESGGWVCLHAAFSSSKNTSVLPWDYQEITQLAWEQYRQAHRLDDKTMLAHAVHPTAQSTFVQGDKVIVRSALCDHNSDDNSTYNALKDHPDIERHDTLQSIEFIGPNLCLVTLKIGHPPCVWTEFLVCGRMGERWWIVHTSSCQEEFEMTQEMIQILLEEEKEDEDLDESFLKP